MPRAVPLVVVRVRVDAPPAAGFGLKDGVDEAGCPESDSVTAPVNPPVRVIVTVYVAVPPVRETLTDDGFTESEKSGGTGGAVTAAEASFEFADSQLTNERTT